MKPITCPCGLPKELVKGYAVCTKHCDKHCPDSPYCPRCRHYSLVTNQRVTAEHAKEKTNG